MIPVAPKILPLLQSRLLWTIVLGGLWIPGTIAPGLAQESRESPVVTRSSLRLGSQGAEVMELQAILQLLGFYAGAIDGVFSPITQQSVQEFQRAAGLVPTGQMTIADWTRLLPPPGSLNSVVGTPNPVNNAAIVPPNPSGLSAQSFPVPEEASQPPSGDDPVANPETPRPSPPEPVSAPEPQDPETLGFPVLRKGDRGNAVEQLQQRLQGLGFYDGAIDGIFGEETETVVKNFQTEYGLEVDGIVGGATWDTLFNTP